MTEDKIYTIVNYYKFVRINDVPALKLAQEKWARELKIKGSILLAAEGINAGICGSRESLHEYCRRMAADERFADVRFVYSTGRCEPFKRFKVKTKGFIVVFPEDQAVDPDEIASAPYLSTGEFRRILKDRPEDVVLIDTRNYYEIDYGTFAGAEHLQTRNFKDFPAEFLKKYQDQRDKTYVMFCTGGIRCEKAAVFAKKAGFAKTYQLDGGVLKYFQEQNGDGWQGNLFVFDNRWSINKALEQGEDGPHPDQLSTSDFSSSI